MRHTLTSLALGLGASAAALKRHECSFEITAHGGAEGCLGSLNDGQCRIGGGYPKTKFILDTTTSVLRDDHGRGCIITESPYQIQCDEGKPGTPGWSVNSEGKLTHDGVCDFAACPVNDYNEWNIYKYTIPDQKKCVHVSLTGNCQSPLPPPPPHQPPPCPCGDNSIPDCKKTCHEKPVPPPPPPAPRCCDDCSPSDLQCKKTCYVKPVPPPVPKPSPPCPQKCGDHDNVCHKSCFKKPVPPPKKAPCPCDECEHGDHECYSTCYEKKKKEPIHSKPAPSSVCCDDCKIWDFSCKAACYEKPKPAPRPSVCCDDCKPKDVKCKKVCYEKPKPTATPCEDGHCKHDKRSEKKVLCGDCPKDDKQCQVSCVTKEVVKEVTVCSDCKADDHSCKKKYCPPITTTKPHYKHPRPTHSLCCDECKADDPVCHSTCYTKTFWSEHSWTETHSSYKVKPTWVPSSYVKENTKSFVISKTKSYVISKTKTYVETKTHHTMKKKPTVVPETWKEIHSTAKPSVCTTCFEKPTYVPPPPPKSICCDDCRHDNYSCYESCYPAKPTWTPPPPPKPVCCDECAPHDWDCHKTCYPAKPTYVPPPPPKPVCCDECVPHDWQCHETCYPAPQTSTWVHPPPPPPPPPSSPVWTSPVPSCTIGQGCYTPIPAPPVWTPLPPPPPISLPPVPQPPVQTPCPCPQCPPADTHCQTTCIKAPKQPAACPADLNGEYQYPHLIIPVNSAEPSKAYGPSYNAIISDTESTIFHFDIPASYAGRQCSLYFFFPEQKDLRTSSYTFSGSGSASWDVLSGTCDAGTSYASAPEKVAHLADQVVRPGNEYLVKHYPCEAGKSVSVQMGGKGMKLEWFQDYNPKPIGMFVRAC